VHSQEKSKYLAAVKGVGARPVFGLKPDLVLRRNGNVIAVGDTKWKLLDVYPSSRHLKPTPADMYQMHAYSAAFQCEHLALIYPWHKGLIESKETIFELPRVGTLQPLVSVFCIDLQSDLFRLVRGDPQSHFYMLLGGDRTHSVAPGFPLS
jgi:5-methylcytosine-specific restriction enzyme subunit McrC